MPALLAKTTIEKMLPYIPEQSNEEKEGIKNILLEIVTKKCAEQKLSPTQYFYIRGEDALDKIFIEAAYELLQANNDFTYVNFFGMKYLK